MKWEDEFNKKWCRGEFLITDKKLVDVFGINKVDDEKIIDYIKQNFIPKCKHEFGETIKCDHVSICEKCGEVMGYWVNRSPKVEPENIANENTE